MEMGGWKPEGSWVGGRVQGGRRACGRHRRDWSPGGLCPQAWASRPCLKVFERLPNGDLSLDISSRPLCPHNSPSCLLQAQAS